MRSHPFPPPVVRDPAPQSPEQPMRARGRHSPTGWTSSPRPSAGKKKTMLCGSALLSHNRRQLRGLTRAPQPATAIEVRCTHDRAGATDSRAAWLRPSGALSAQLPCALQRSCCDSLAQCRALGSVSTLSVRPRRLTQASRWRQILGRVRGVNTPILPAVCHTRIAECGPRSPSMRAQEDCAKPRPSARGGALPATRPGSPWHATCPPASSQRGERRRQPA